MREGQGWGHFLCTGLQMLVLDGLGGRGFLFPCKGSFQGLVRPMSGNLPKLQVSPWLLVGSPALKAVPPLAIAQQ